MAQISKDGEDLESAHNFDICSSSVYPEGFLCRGQIAVPGHNCPRQSRKKVI